MAIDRNAVWEAADGLAANNERVTLEAIRKALGSGSFTTIRKFVEEWKAKRSTAGVATPSAVPEAIEQACARMGNEIWMLASSSAERRLSAEREALLEAGSAAETSVQEAMALADRIDLELTAARERILQLEAMSAEQAKAFREIERKLLVETALRTKVEAMIEQREQAYAALQTSANEYLTRCSNTEGRIELLAHQNAALLAKLERASPIKHAS